MSKSYAEYRFANKNNPNVLDYKTFTKDRPEYIPAPARAKPTQATPTEQQAKANVNSINQQIAAKNNEIANLWSDVDKAAAMPWDKSLSQKATAGLAKLGSKQRELDALNEKLKAAEDKQRKAIKTNARRDELRSTIKNAQEYSGWATDDLSRANMGIDTAERDRQKNLEQLKAVDARLGNIERPYDDRQRAGYTVGGALKNTGASIIEAGTTFADLMSKYNSQNPYLTTEEMGMAGAMGMTPEEYLKMKQRGGTEEARQEAFGQYYDMADRLMQESAHDIAVAKTDLSALGQAGVDLSVNLVQMGADAAGRAIGLGMLPFFTRAAGGSAYEARQEGATLEQRAGYGALKGAIEVGTEKLFDGVAGIFGKGVADDVVESVVRKLAKTNNGRTALRALAGATGEGIEEVISDLLDPFAKLIYNDQALKEAWENRKDLAGDMLYDYLIGFAMGGLGAGSSIVSGQDAAKNNAARKADSESYELFEEQQNALEDIRAQTLDDTAKKLGYLFGYDTLDEVNATQAAQNNTAPRGNEQLNIDNAGQPRYNLDNENINGGRLNDTLGTRGPLERAGGLTARGAEGTEYTESGVRRPGFRSFLEEQSGERGQLRNSSVIRTVVPVSVNEALDKNGVVNLGLRDSTNDKAVFSSAIDQARNLDTRNGWAVSPQTVESLTEEGTKTFLAADNMAGIGVKTDGDITAVFKNPNSRQKGVIRDLMATALSNGGNKLDCYGEGLVDLYVQQGFIPVARVKFNPEYANEGWTPDKGTPDIYFMMHNGDNPDSVVNKYNQYRDFTQADLDALPLMEYDEAYAYRDSLLAERQQRKAQYDYASMVLGLPDSSQTQQNAAGAREATESVNTGAESQNAGEGARGFNDGGNGNLRERGFTKNVRTDAAMEETLRRDLEENRVLYSQLSNADTLEKAKTIFRQGFDEARDTVVGALARAQGGMKLSPEIVPLGRMVANELTRRGELDASHKIISDIAAELTEAGRLGQAGLILRNADPATVLDTLEKSIAAINEEVQRKYGKRYKWRAELTEAEIDQIANTDFTQDGAFEEVQQQIATRLGEEMPATLMEKIREFRKVGMLFNPRTQLKNVAANAPLMGERKIAEKMSGAIQDLAVKAGIMSKENQTRTIKVGKEYRELAKNIYQSNIENIRGRGNKTELRGVLRNERTYFKGFAVPFGKYKGHRPSETVNKFLNSQIDRIMEALPPEVRAKVPEIELRGGLLETVRRATYGMLEAGDSPFVKSAFVDSLAEYCAAHKLSTEETVSQEAIDYATDQAMMATFKDASALAKLLNSIKDKTGIFGEAVDIILPFTTTPINIGKEYIKYSPFGIFQLLANKNATGAEIADIISRATTGSAVVALGALLRSLGWITGGEDDDKDKAAYDRAMGISPYSFGGKYSYEWAQPTGSALAMGAAIYDATKDSDGFLETVMDGIIASGDSYLEQSFFKNITDIFEGNGSKSEKVLNALIQGAFSQLTPSGGAAIARTIDPVVRSNYTGGNTFDNALASAKSRIPWLSKEQPASVNVKGEENTRGALWERILDNYILPWNTNRNGKNTSNVDDIISEVYESTGKNDIFPQVSPYSIDYGGENYRLDGRERETFQTLQGQTYYNVAEALAGDGVFQRMSDTDKAKVLADISQYSLEKAKQEFFGSRNVDYTGSDSGTWAKAEQAMDAGMSFAEWEAARMKKSELDKSGQKATQKTQDFYQFLDDSGYSQKEKELLREQFGFYSQNRADPKQYDRLTASGFSTSEADRIFDIVSAVTPKEGESSVSNAQKAEAISDISGLNDGDKLRALEAYFAPDSSGKRNTTVRRYEAAMNAGKTFDEWTECVSAMEEYSPSTKTQKIAVLDRVFPGEGRALYEIWNEPDADKYIEGAPEPKTSKQKNAEWWDEFNNSGVTNGKGLPGVTDPMTQDYLGYLLGYYDNTGSDQVAEPRGKGLPGVTDPMREDYLGWLLGYYN